MQMVCRLFLGSEVPSFKHCRMVTAALRLFFFWLVSCHRMISSASGSYADQNHFIYNGFGEANLLLDGIAKVQPNGLLQLTNFSSLQAAHAFYPFPVRFNTSSSSGSARSYSFSTNFVFSIIPEQQDFGGHGLCFVISPSTNFIHAIATQYLGLFNVSNNGLPGNHVLAIEFDTVRSPDFNDIDNNHVGIDANSLISVQSATVTYFSSEARKSRTLDLASGNPIQVWIDYDDVGKLLNVTVAPLNIPKPTNPLLSKSIDLSEILLDTMHVGFSASTGEMVSEHYILGWSFNRSGLAQSLEISKLPEVPRQERGLRGRNQLILSIASAIFLLLVILWLSVYCYRRRKCEEVRDDWEREYGPQRFSYRTLYKATEGFKEKHLLGSGGFGKVYRGTLPLSNEQIAVKRINHNSEQGIKEFVSEIVTMGRLRHRNLVPLLGYCRLRKELLLVYEYMPNGSLDKFLFGDTTQKLTWCQRFHVLKGVASALLYLHEEWEQVVLHRDIKASNVMLDSNLNARLGDFGLARLYDHDKNPPTTHLVGTLGYLAPELFRIGKATTSSDVYAFGAFLLEVACGRKPIEPQQQPEEVFLVDWVSNCWKREAILVASDPRLEGNYIGEEMELILKLGLLCSRTSAEGRPTMKQVVQYLDENADLDEAHSDYREIGLSRTINEASISLDFYQMCLTGPGIEASNIAISIPLTIRETSRFSFSSSESVLCVGR